MRLSISPTTTKSTFEIQQEKDTKTSELGHLRKNSPPKCKVRKKVINNAKKAIENHDNKPVYKEFD